MTVTNTDNKDIYVGDGATLIFAYTYRILLAADLIVTITDTLGVNPVITGVLDSDYSVSNVGNPAGGNVTLILGGQIAAEPLATDDVTILRIEPLTQNLDLIENDDFPSQSQEDAFDKLTFITQQLQEQLDRAVLLASNITGVDLTLPTPEAGAPIGWNDTADGLTNNPDQTNLSQIDTAAAPDFIGALSSDGVLRTGTSLSYADGGDFVTIDTIQPILVSSSPTFNALTLTSLIMGVTITAIIDDDTMATATATNIATAESIKAYVDNLVLPNDTFIEHSDTPAAYAGNAGTFLMVNATPDAVEFVTIATVEPLLTHDNLTGVVANQHIDHSTVSITTTVNTSGLSGGGDITATRTLAVDIANTTAGTVASLDEVLIADVDDSDNLKRVTAQSIADLGAGGGAIEVLDEGISLNAAISSIDFVGAGVVATNIGSAITVTIAGGGGGATLDLDVTQANAFSVGEWIYHNGTIYVLADASDASTAESIGVITAATGADFTVQFGGRVTGLSGLTIGEAHFLSETAGAITATAPTTIGAVVKPVLVADSATTGFIFNMRGIEVASVGSAGVFRDTFVDGDLPIVTINHGIGQKIVLVQVFDENDDLVQPDDITLTDTDNLDIDLTSFGTISGTWNVVVTG